MSDQNLTPQQHQVLALIATGSTLSAAAEAVGIRRNTIANWRRTQPAFKQEFHEAQSEQAVHWRDQMQSLGAIAVDAIRSVLTDKNTTPATRLKAALAVLNNLMKPAPVPESAKPTRPRPAESEDSDLPELLSEFEIRERKMERLNFLVQAEILLKETAQVAQPCTIEPQHAENKQSSEGPRQSPQTQAHNPAQPEAVTTPVEDPGEEKESLLAA